MKPPWLPERQWYRPRDQERDAAFEAHAGLAPWKPLAWSSFDDLFYEKMPMFEAILLYEREDDNGKSVLRDSLVARLRMFEAQTGCPSGWKEVAYGKPGWETFDRQSRSPLVAGSPEDGWSAFESAIRALVPPLTAPESQSDSGASGGSSGSEGAG